MRQGTANSVDVASEGLAMQRPADGRSQEPSGNRRWDQFIKWSGFSAVVFPVLTVLSFTVAGFLRPGYSPVSQTISDLGVGPMAWLLNIPLGMLGLVLLAFGLAFSEATRPVMSSRWRWICGMLVGFPGLGLVGASVFTEDPSTLLAHIVVGALLGLYVPVVTFFVVGLRLVRSREWRGYGIYSWVAGLATVAAIAFMQLAFVPGSPLEGWRLGGLAERVDLIVILAWYVVMGWRLFSNSRLVQKEKNLA